VLVDVKLACTEALAIPLASIDAAAQSALVQQVEGAGGRA
jgi:hypothetical protein